MLQCDVSKCTGCGACVQACPTSCVKMEEDNEGFLYPEVDVNGCIDCGRCESICPIGKSIQIAAAAQKAYAAVSLSEEELQHSTSGGAFSAIARYVYEQNGTVYGCAYSEDMVAIHKRTTCVEELVQLNGSKYVQSNLLETYAEAERDLEQGRLVLYSGTPCQIAGLYAYLGDKPDNLITVDLVCHGVPSPGYFRKFVAWLSKKESADIVDVDFRDKRNRGWSLAGTYSVRKFNTSKISRAKLFYFNNYYYGYFLSGDLYRTCCYDCQYANMNRCADFTLGDLWGAEGLNLDFSMSKGCSLVLVNTRKAGELLHNLRMQLQEIPVQFPQQTNGQLVGPAEKSALRAVLYEEYKTCSAEQIQRTYLRRRKKQVVLGCIKYCVPNRIKHILLKMKYKYRLHGTMV